MNYRLIGKYIGFILLVEGIFLLPAIVVSAAYREPQSARAIAIAAVIFGKFKPQGAFKACLLFGLCNGIKALLGAGNAVSPNLVSMIPYVVTILALVFVVGSTRVPAANGKPFLKAR